MMIAPTAHRVARHTDDQVNQDIERATRRRVEHLADHPEQIPARLAELDREWDIERCLEVGSATFTLTGLLLGTTVDRRWLWLSAVVQGFFMQHALQGWCPPLPVFRRLGVRTATEIERERHALKALLGDFEGASGGDGQEAWRAAGARTLEGASA